MNSQPRTHEATRRGVVLILVLAMLGLLAIIGVSFATFSGQARYAGRNFATKLAIPPAENLIDFGLAQLINDTSNPMSALYGHGIKRDMYGSNAGANGFLNVLPNGQPLTITNFTRTTGAADVLDNWTVATNIPASLGLDFAGWSMVLSAGAGEIKQTLQVTGGATGTGFYVLNVVGGYINNTGVTDRIDRLALPLVGRFFTLDGRYIRGFDGRGMANFDGNTALALGASTLDGNTKAAQFANLRLAGPLLNNDPLSPPYPLDVNRLGVQMDEDYDAPDLENWFLAVQSADGEVVIPSFHRPGILADYDAVNNPGVTTDWTLPDPRTLSPLNPIYLQSLKASSKILRPRAVDHPSAGVNTFPNLVPTVDVDGNGTLDKIVYDVDNDGDGQTDSVWVDLGHPPIRGSDGKSFKPLYAFMVLGLNGRIPLNTAGNLNARKDVDDTPTNATDFDDAGMPLFDHASHLGYSPSEINPKYALQNAFDNTAVADGLKPNHRQFDTTGYLSVDLTQLRNLLAGTRAQANARPTDTFDGERNFVWSNGGWSSVPNNVADLSGLAAVPDVSPDGVTVPRTLKATPGRWGEVDGIPFNLTSFFFADAAGVADPQATSDAILQRSLNYQSTIPSVPGYPYRSVPNPIRAGLSPQADFKYQVDGIDNNFDALDFFPPRTPAGLNPVIGPERGDALVYTDGSTNSNDPSRADDGTNTAVLTSERFQRSVTPADLSGNGRVLRFDGLPTGTALNGFGPDRWGRVSFFHFYRPPGVPQRDGSTDPNENFFTNNGPNEVPAVTNSFPFRLNRFNSTRGYESFRSPGGANGFHMGAMPYNRSNASGAGSTPRYNAAVPPTNLYDITTGQQRYVGTFDENINSQLLSALDPANPLISTGNAAGVWAAVHSYPFGGLRYNDPDEMSLYGNDSNDEPFTYADLEYLYRRDDVDGDSLDSRLATLAPISFEASPDAAMRRRMFSTDVFDRTNYSFPTDRNRVATPSIAQGDRRINLNFPLPHSYDPFEPTRQKWITETYVALKQILPVTATDTLAELAELGQFVVNIVDFRDPDNTITIWDNPDVAHVPAQRVGTTDTQPGLAPFALGMERFRTYGMEYNPVAINEVLGYRHNYSESDAITPPGANQRSTRMFIELVNMLTDGQAGFGSSGLDLANWQFTLVREDPVTTIDPTKRYYHPAYVRPDPFNGQMPKVQESGFIAPSFNAVGVGSGLSASTPGARTTLPYSIKGFEPSETDPTNLDPGGTTPENDRVYYVLTGARYEGDPPETTNFIRQFVGDNPNTLREYTGDLDGDGDVDKDDEWHLLPSPVFPPVIADPAETDSFPTVQGLYHWLYMSRPANPLAPPDPVTNPMVVVDSIRFPFTSSDIRGTVADSTNPMHTDNPYDQPVPGPGNPADDATPWMYSVERRQPFRGAQVVPSLGDPTWNTPDYTYGSSEQVRPSNGGDLYGVFDTFRPQLINDVAIAQDNTTPFKNRRVHTTGEIHQTLGNSIRSNPGDPSDKVWDYLHFNDRDFVSVAELLMVPGCPPGLFTKRFVETNGPLDSPNPAVEPGVVLNPTPPPTRPVFTTPGNGISASFDKANVHNHPYLTDHFYYSGTVGGDGWHRMLEVFEVPAPTLGAIAPVAQGVNLDWYREDRRPGQINLNLVVDEEVFFGVFDDPRLLDTSINGYKNSLIQDAERPRVVTQVDDLGSPLSSYPMANRGFTTFTDATGDNLAFPPSAASFSLGGMKRPFADFLKLRHGGSGYLYGFGNGPTGTPFKQATFDPAFDDPRIARDRPYRSMATNDVNDTLLRPATLPPSAYTTPPLVASTNAQYRPDLGSPPDLPFIWQSPGDRNPNYPIDRRVTAPGPGNPAFPPPIRPIPPRRLLQFPDSELYVGTPGPDLDSHVSNASPIGPYPRASYLPLGSYQPPEPIAGSRAYLPVTTYRNPLVNVFPVSPATYEIPARPPVVPAPIPVPGGGGIFLDTTQHLGQHNIVTPPLPLMPANATMFGAGAPPAPNGDPGAEQVDTRRHPYYRTELLQKVMNLTTPRTQQFAVWVTVGLFEVVRPGDATKLIPDQLGPEIGASSGSHVRYRSFFVVDRTRATGFNPYNPGDHRDLVVYKRRIE